MFKLVTRICLLITQYKTTNPQSFRILNLTTCITDLNLKTLRHETI